MVSRVYLYHFDWGTDSFYWVSSCQTKGGNKANSCDVSSHCRTPLLSQSGPRAAVNHIKTWVIYQKEAQRGPEWCACVSDCVASRKIAWLLCSFKRSLFLGFWALCLAKGVRISSIFFRIRMSKHERGRSISQLKPCLSFAHVPSTDTVNNFDVEVKCCRHVVVISCKMQP